MPPQTSQSSQTSQQDEEWLDRFDRCCMYSGMLPAYPPPGMVFK
jgi:hypothetical protein